MDTHKRKNPNILITGTPGTGKSTLSRLLAERTKYNWRDVSQLAHEHNCLDEYDHEYQCPILNEDKIEYDFSMSVCDPDAFQGYMTESQCGSSFEPSVTDGQFPLRRVNVLLDIMESLMSNGGNIVDYHSSELFPERWFDAVFVVRTNNTLLHDRLSARGYTGKKLDDNIQCEIFETQLEEAQSSYKPEIVTELRNDTEEQLSENINNIVVWIENWKENNL